MKLTDVFIIGVAVGGLMVWAGIRINLWILRQRSEREYPGVKEAFDRGFSTPSPLYAHFEKKRKQ